MEAVPILRLELQGMQRTLSVALHEYAVSLDADIQLAIAKFCTPENMQALIQHKVMATLDMIVGEEVERFFRHGNGQATVRHAVEQYLGRLFVPPQ